jgi:hypothetical protein
MSTFPADETVRTLKWRWANPQLSTDDPDVIRKIDSTVERIDQIKQARGQSAKDTSDEALAIDRQRNQLLMMYLHDLSEFGVVLSS